MIPQPNLQPLPAPCGDTVRPYPPGFSQVQLNVQSSGTLTGSGYFFCGQGVTGNCYYDWTATWNMDADFAWQYAPDGLTEVGEFASTLGGCCSTFPPDAPVVNFNDDCPDGVSPTPGMVAPNCYSSTGTASFVAAPEGKPPTPGGLDCTSCSPYPLTGSCEYSLMARCWIVPSVGAGNEPQYAIYMKLYGGPDTPSDFECKTNPIPGSFTNSLGNPEPLGDLLTNSGSYYYTDPMSLSDLIGTHSFSLGSAPYIVTATVTVS